MLKQQRQDIISRELRNRSFISMEEAMALTDSSRSTIRRDMDEMEADGRIIRIRGGASAAAQHPEQPEGRCLTCW
jgi:DeoR family fructose operon transcriptional repressor